MLKVEHPLRRLETALKCCSNLLLCCCLQVRRMMLCLRSCQGSNGGWSVWCSCWRNSKTVTCLGTFSWICCRQGLYTYWNTQSNPAKQYIVCSFAQTVAEKLVLRSLWGCSVCIPLFNLSSIISWHLLQELTSWAAAEDEEKADKEELDVSAMTLLEVEQQLVARAVRRGQRLALLQVLAVMVETLHHALLLRKSTQVSEEMWR